MLCLVLGDPGHAQDFIDAGHAAPGLDQSILAQAAVPYLLNREGREGNCTRTSAK